jgi:hypothetical protein
MGCGILTPRIIETSRKVLGRPKRSHGGSGSSAQSSALSPTGMIEDIAVVEERYQLAKWLGVSPDAVPTEQVSYTFPWRVWVPCAIEDDMSVCVSVRFEGNGQFRMCNAMDKREVDATPASADQKGFLDGRLCERVRPLCFFDRPGVLLFGPFGPAVILRYDHLEVKYVVRTAGGAQTQHVDPLDMERMVYRIGQPFLVNAEGLVSHRNGGRAPMLVHEPHVAAEEPTYVSPGDKNGDGAQRIRLLLCTLRMPDDETLEGQVPVYVRSFPTLASRQRNQMAAMSTMMDTLESIDDNRTMRLPPVPLHVSIEHVVRRGNDDGLSSCEGDDPMEEEEDPQAAETACSFVFFHGISLSE